VIYRRGRVSGDADSTIDVREPRGDDPVWIARFLREAWGSVAVVSRGRRHDASRLPALLAVEDEEIVGLATLRPDGSDCELVTLDAVVRGRGVGSALLDAAAEWARDRGCRRLWLITSNDNLDALRFYQRRGMRLVAVHRGAVDTAREMKPSIPEVGEYGIPLHDELELERSLAPRDPVQMR
jgi:GNAT superfamily N-acetyltransferase